MKLAYTAILAVLLLSGAPALAQIHNGTDGVTPGVKVPDPNAPGTLRSGNGPMYGTPGSTTGSGTSSSSGAQSTTRAAPTGRMGDTVPPPAPSSPSAGRMGDTVPPPASSGTRQ
jgi:hypothetical protein